MIYKDRQVRRLEYFQPRAEEYIFVPENVVCESPLPGGNEGVGYETWQ